MPGPRALTTPAAAPARLFLALALILSVALGAAVPHAAVVEHTSSPVGVDVDQSAQHPRDPVHFEASRLEHHPACAACLFHLQSGSPFGQPTAVHAPIQGETVRSSCERTSSQLAISLGPARAPPQAPLPL